MLRDGLGLDDASDVLRSQRGVIRALPGTKWWFQTHGIGVCVFREDETGGIDFDFDKPDPDGWRLHWFARAQMEEGVLPPGVYERTFADVDRLEGVLSTVLAERRN